MVRGGSSSADPELLRAGRTDDARRCCRRKSVLSPRAFLPSVAADRTCCRRRRGRVPGAHLGRVLADAAEHPARLLATHADCTYLATSCGADLRAGSEHGPHGGLSDPRSRIRKFQQSQCGVRHSRHWHHGHHDAALRCRRPLAMEVVARERRSLDVSFSGHRLVVSARQCCQDCTWRLGTARHGSGRIRVDEYLETWAYGVVRDPGRTCLTDGSLPGEPRTISPASCARHRRVHDVKRGRGTGSAPASSEA